MKTKEEMFLGEMGIHNESNSTDIETMAAKVFTLANELAVKGYGNAAVKMHSIHNGMITKDHYYSRKTP